MPATLVLDRFVVYIKYLERFKVSLKSPCQLIGVGEGKRQPMTAFCVSSFKLVSVSYLYENIGVGVFKRPS